VAAAQNIDDLMKYYASDAVLYEGIVPDIFRGAAAIRENFAKQLEGVKSIKIESRNSRLRAAAVWLCV